MVAHPHRLRQPIQASDRSLRRQTRVSVTRPDDATHEFERMRQTHAVLHQLSLLLLRFDPHEPHRRAPHRLADCRGVGRIVLVALKVSLHVLRRHQANFMSELRQLPRPIMRRGTGLDAD